MKDFYSFDEFSIPLWIKTLFWSLYMVIFAYAVWKMLLWRPKDKRQLEVNKLFIVYFIAYAVFYCVNPDYFRYREWLNVDDFLFWTKENFYIHVVLFCRSLPFDYPFELFRLIVWGGAVLISFLTFRLYRGLLLPGLALLFLFVLTTNTFSYSRSSLAMAIYFFGIAIVRCQKGINKKLLGVGVAMSSFFFHHEMILAISVMPFLFIPFERKSFSFLSIFGLIIVVVSISYISTNSQFLDLLFDNDDISSKIEDFNEAEQGTFRLSTFINYFKYYYPFFVITKCFWKNMVPHSVVGMYRITYAIIMVTVAFMIVYGLRSVYTYRVLYISMIPLSLLICYCYYNGYLKKKELLLMMILALLSNSIRFINS